MRRRSSYSNSAVMLAVHRKLAKGECFETDETFPWDEDDAHHIEAHEVQNVLREIRAYGALRLDANLMH